MKPLTQRPTIELIRPDGTGQLYEVDADTITIGRDPVSVIAIDDDERHVSWRHARIERLPGGVFHAVGVWLSAITNTVVQRIQFDYVHSGNDCVQAAAAKV